MPQYGQPAYYPDMNPAYSGGPTPGYAPPPARRRSPIIPIAIVAGVVIVALIIGVVVRYNGPISVSKAFVQNLFQFDSAATLKQVCTTPDAAKLRQEVSASNISSQTLPKITADISQLAFTITSESLTSAKVSFSGKVTLKSASGASSGSQPASGALSLDASGLWWCVSSVAGTTGSGG